MRTLADLVQKAGSEHGKKKGDPEDRFERFEPNAEEGANGNSRRNHQRQAKPACQRPLVIGEGEEQAGNAADQSSAGLAPRGADEDRKPDIDEKERSATGLEVMPYLTEQESRRRVPIPSVRRGPIASGLCIVH